MNNNNLFNMKIIEMTRYIKKFQYENQVFRLEDFPIFYNLELSEYYS